jgi:hypothetical protein
MKSNKEDQNFDKIAQDKFSWLFNTMLFIASIIICLGAIIILNSLCPFIKECPHENLLLRTEFFTNRYQTLITGIIALAIGAVTIGHIRRQIRFSEKQYQGDKKEQWKKLYSFMTALEKETLDYVMYFEGVRQSLSGTYQAQIRINPTSREETIKTGSGFSIIKRRPITSLYDENIIYLLSSQDIINIIEIRTLLDEIKTVYNQYITEENGIYSVHVSNIGSIEQIQASAFEINRTFQNMTYKNKPPM